MQDIDIMKSSIVIMGGYLEGLKLLQNREKRSVLPIMGKVLNVLFGTVSKEKLDVVKSKLSAFEKDQLALARKDSISILNISRVEFAGNCRSINQLGERFFLNTIEARKYHRGPYDSSIVARRLREKISSFFEYYQSITSEAANLIGPNTRFESRVGRAFFGSFISKYSGPNPSHWRFRPNYPVIWDCRLTQQLNYDTFIIQWVAWPL